MPGFDRSGPMGAGPMTGGARGYCNPAGAGYGRPAVFGRGMGSGRGTAYGRGLGRGYGPGRGFMRGYVPGFAPYAAGYVQDPVNELNVLQRQAEEMKNTLDSIHRRIAELETVE